MGKDGCIKSNIMWKHVKERERERGEWRERGVRNTNIKFFKFALTYVILIYCHIHHYAGKVQ